MNFEIVGRPRDAKTIARGRAIRELRRLRRAYGLAAWRKVKGVATIRLSDGVLRTAELHWYEAHGVGRKEFKIIVGALRETCATHGAITLENGLIISATKRIMQMLDGEYGRPVASHDRMTWRRWWRWMKWNLHGRPLGRPRLAAHGQRRTSKGRVRAFRERHGD